MMYVTREVERGRTSIAVCVAASMLACVAHLFCVYARRQWYVRNRTPTVVALRMALVCFLLSAWASSSWRLKRLREMSSRVLMGTFLSLAYHLPSHLLQLELQVVLLAITRVLLFSATRRERMECSYVGVCRKSDGVDVGHMHLWDADVPYEERTASTPLPFAYSFDGLLFDALLLIVFPLALTNVKQRALEVSFAREESRREAARRRRRFFKFKRDSNAGDDDARGVRVRSPASEGTRPGSLAELRNGVGMRDSEIRDSGARDELEGEFEEYGEGYEDDAETTRRLRRRRVARS